MIRDRTSHWLREGGEGACAAGAAGAALVGGPGRIVAVTGVDGVGAMGVRGDGTPAIQGDDASTMMAILQVDLEFIERFAHARLVKLYM